MSVVRTPTAREYTAQGEVSKAREVAIPIVAPNNRVSRSGEGAGAHLRPTGRWGAARKER